MLHLAQLQGALELHTPDNTVNGAPERYNLVLVTIIWQPA